jgi:hypothetical protein
MSVTQQMVINQITNPADKELLMRVLRTCSDSLTRISAERDLIKDEVKSVCDKLELPKRLVNRLVKTYHKQNFDEEVTVNEQFQTLYETVVN